MLLDRVLLWGLILILVLAPLPFGSVLRPSIVAMELSCLALGILWVFWRSRRGLSSLPWREPVLVAGGLLILLGMAQILPLPRPVLETLSPRAVELRDQYEPRLEAMPDLEVKTLAPYRGWRPLSLYPWATRQSLLKLVAYLLAALITIDLAASRRARRALFIALVASGGFQAIYGLTEYFTGHQQIFAFKKVSGVDVATGTFINRNHFAGYLEMTLPLAIALAASGLSRPQGSRESSWSRKLTGGSDRRLFAAGALLLLSLVMATALLCSGSRVGVASAILALVAVSMVLMWRGRGKSFAISAVLVAGVLLILFSQGGGDDLLRRFMATPDELRGRSARWSIWSQTISIVEEFPLLGTGLGTFPFINPVFQTSGEGLSFTHAHNDYLETASEMGAAGCLIVLLGISLVVRSLRHRSERSPGLDTLHYSALGGSTALAFHSITDFNMAIPSNALALVVLLALVVSRRRTVATAPRTSEPRRQMVRALIPAGLMGTIALLAIAPVIAKTLPGIEEFPGGTSGRAVSTPKTMRFPWTLVSDGDNADRIFDAASVLGDAAIADLQTLTQAHAAGSKPTELALQYIQDRLHRIIHLQATGLQEWPTSSGGHFYLGLLKASHCSVSQLTTPETRDCFGTALPEINRALELNPMSAATHARAGRFLIASWPYLDARQRVIAERVISRALRMNPSDRLLRQGWVGVQEDR